MFSIVINFNYIVKNVEEGVSITVFFDEDADQATIDAIGEQIKARTEVTEVEYVSAQQAWDEFKKIILKTLRMPRKGFENDNPLSNAANYVC